MGYPPRCTLYLSALVCGFVLLPASAAAQAFQGLSTTDDGSVLYFSSSIRPIGSDLTFHYKIFRWDATNGFQVVAEVRDEVPDQVCEPGNFYNLYSPQVSADGTVLAYTGQRQVFYSSLSFHCPIEESYQGVIRRNGQEIKLDGNLALTSNGRYAVTTPALAAQNEFHVVTDLTSRISTIVAGAFNGSPQRLTDEATIMTPEANAVILTDRDGFTRVIQTLKEVYDVIISRSGGTLLYLSSMSPSQDAAYVSRLDIGTGNETLVAGPGYAFFNLGLTADGNGWMFALPFSGYDLLVPNAAGVKIPDGIANAILSGDGRVSYVVTRNSRLLRVDAVTGNITELAASTPQITAPYLLNAVPVNPITHAAAGAVLDLAGFGNMHTADFCGHPSARLLGSGIRFQVPFDTPDGDCQVVVRADSSFENAFHFDIVPFDPRFSSLLHQDFSGDITQFKPAHPGENMVAYLTGLGRLDASGHLAPGLQCTFDQISADVLYAGLTPNFPGVYQVNIQVPNLSPRNASLVCGFPGDQFGGYYGFTTVPIGSQ